MACDLKIARLQNLLNEKQLVHMESG